MLLTLPLLAASSRPSLARHALAADPTGRVWTDGDPSDFDAAAGAWRRLLATPQTAQYAQSTAPADAPLAAAADAIAVTAAWALWIADVNLCPFARKSLETAKAIRYVHTEARTEAAFFDACAACARDTAWMEDPTAAITFLVAPAFEAQSFPAFNDSIETLEDEVLPYRGGDAVQMAGFHPAWDFGGLGDDDPVQFEKRAPFPTVSFVLGVGLEHADSERIGADNERTLEALGVEAVARVFAGFK
jgi:hypothetical protein